MRKMNTMIKCYSELISLPTFKERFDYLQCVKRIGVSTFGEDRYLNQMFYHSYEWKELRDQIILRDEACDLGIDGREIGSKRLIRVHHINPITIDDIYNHSRKLTDPENLITCLDRTHQAIHFTGYDGVTDDPVVRTPFDTCPWR